MGDRFRPTKSFASNSNYIFPWSEMDCINHDFRIFHWCKCLRFREEEVWSDDYCFSLGLIDSSGLRFHYTRQLRKYESGVLLVGADVNRAMLIPPKQRDWKINSFCSSDCTQKVLPSTFICYSTQFGAGSACFYIEIKTENVVCYLYNQNIRAH